MSSTRRKTFKSVNTMQTSQSSWMANISSDASLLQRKIEELTNDTSSTDSEIIDYPIPYTFRVILSEGASRNSQARCPPFYMQLDHTIAVLWHVFAHKDIREPLKNIGIGQLQWALYFLKGIKDPLEGTRQADIDIAIKAIEDALIECYAEMANLVMKKPHMKEEFNESSTTSVEETIPKRIVNIGASASLGTMRKGTRSNFIQPESFNMSSLSFTTFERYPDLSSKFEEFIRFRNAHDIPNINFCPIESHISTTNKDDNSSTKQVTNAYEMLKKLREEEVRKLNREIDTLRQLEEASSIRTYFKIILKYCETFKLWTIICRIVVVTVRLIFDQFRMDDIYVH